MTFDNIPEHNLLKKNLLESIDKQSIAHAQMFIGKEGGGALALGIAYAHQVLCHNLPEKSRISCYEKCEKLSHPDLHFIIPIASNENVKSRPMSHLFLDEWKTFLQQQPFGSLFDWYKAINIENKQGQIGVDDTLKIIQTLSLKPYESYYKVVILWMPEKLNINASNKLLKIIEEPPQNTLFLLVTENEENVINTIKSRCQTLYIDAFSDLGIQKYLEQKGAKPNSALQISKIAKGNLNKAISILNKNSEDVIFEKWFVSLVRIAFSTKENKNNVLKLIDWSNELAKVGREVQKQFIKYSLEIFRQTLLKNYDINELVYIHSLDETFFIENFMPFIHSNNINKIFKLFDASYYNIERNANAKIIFMDMAIHLTRYLHIKKSIDDFDYNT